MQRYELHLVIFFEAITRPKLFTGALLELLVRLRAPLSQSLTQIIQVLWNPTVRELVYRLEASIRWAGEGSACRLISP